MPVFMLDVRGSGGLGNIVEDEQVASVIYLNQPWCLGRKIEPQAAIFAAIALAAIFAFLIDQQAAGISSKLLE